MSLQELKSFEYTVRNLSFFLGVIDSGDGVMVSVRGLMTVEVDAVPGERVSGLDTAVRNA